VLHKPVANLIKNRLDDGLGRCGVFVLLLLLLLLPLFFIVASTRVLKLPLLSWSCPFGCRTLHSTPLTTRGAMVKREGYLEAIDALLARSFQDLGERVGARVAQCISDRDNCSAWIGRLDHVWERRAQVEPHRALAYRDVCGECHRKRERVERTMAFSRRRSHGFERTWLDRPLQHAKAHGARRLHSVCACCPRRLLVSVRLSQSWERVAVRWRVSAPCKPQRAETAHTALRRSLDHSRIHDCLVDHTGAHTVRETHSRLDRGAAVSLGTY
jgi:hypothetical protein